MSKIVLSFPCNGFKKEFIEDIANKNLGVNGDQLADYLRETVHTNKRGTGLFKHNLVYCCKTVGTNVLLVGTTV